jgi:hypothetical protein
MVFLKKMTVLKKEKKNDGLFSQTHTLELAL